MICLAFWLFKYLSIPAHNNGICGNNKSWLAPVRVDFGLIDIDGFLGCGGEDIFEWRKVLGEVLGELGGYYLEIGKAYLKYCQIGFGGRTLTDKAMNLGGVLPEQGDVFDAAKQMLE